MAQLNTQFAELVRSELLRRHQLVIRSQRKVARMMIQGWAPVNRRFNEQRRQVNERNAQLATSYPNPDVNDLLASVNELSQILFEHPMHTLVDVMLANARALLDDDEVFPRPCGPALMEATLTREMIRHVRQVLATWRGMLDGGCV